MAESLRIYESKLTRPWKKQQSFLAFQFPITHMEHGRHTPELRGVRQVLEGIRNLKNWMKYNGLSDEEIRGIVGPVEEYITEILLYSGMSCK